MNSLPPWSVVQSLLLTVVLPGFAVGAGALAVVCVATRSGIARLIGGALALAGGLALGNFTRGLLPWWSLEPGWPSLFPATLVAIGGGVVAALAATRRGTLPGAPSIARPDASPAPMPSDARRSTPSMGRIGFLTVAGCTFWLAPTGSLLIHLGFFALLFTASALNCEAFRRIGTRSLGHGALLTLAIPWGLAAATVLIYAASARFFDMAVLLTATLAGLGFVAARWKPDVAALFAGPAVFFPALMLGGAANTFSEVPAASFILVALAPCLLWGLSLPPLRRWSGRTLAIAAIVAVLIPCVVAVILAMRAETLDFGR